MIDYESTRPAFEGKYHTSCERRENGEYVEPIHQTGWEHWCRALDYAAQHPAPAPLPRPDKPGWWWRWLDHGAEPSWHAERITNNDVVWYSRDGSRPGIWLPATPPPAPNGSDHRHQPGARVETKSNS